MHQKIKTIILESPIEFILIGTINNRRTILAKSKDAKVDLRSYSSFDFLFEKKINSTKKIINSFIFLNKIELKPMKINSKNFSMKDPDFSSNNRLDNLTFIWRGLASESYQEVISDIFNKQCYSISYSYFEHDYEQFEWDLSDIISLCDLALKERLSYLNRKRKFSQMIIFTYSLLILIMIILSFVKITFKTLI